MAGAIWLIFVLYNFMITKNKQKETNYWDPNFAYDIGLIATDDCLGSDKRHIEFSSKDLEVVKIFKKCPRLKNNICKKSRGTFPPRYYHRIQSLHIDSTSHMPYKHF